MGRERWGQGDGRREEKWPGEEEGGGEGGIGEGERGSVTRF